MYPVHAVEEKVEQNIAHDECSLDVAKVHFASKQ